MTPNNVSLMPSVVFVAEIVRWNHARLVIMTTTFYKRRILIFFSHIVPGWSRVEEYARKTWGTGDWEITINPPGVSELYLMTKGSLLIINSVQR